MSAPIATIHYEFKDEDFQDAESSNVPNAIIYTTPNDLLIPSSISLYVLRHADPSENWKIQVLFGDNVKLDFKAGKPLISSKVSLLRKSP
jgi:hypothetical protein